MATAIKNQIMLGGSSDLLYVLYFLIMLMAVLYLLTAGYVASVSLLGASCKSKTVCLFGKKMRRWIKTVLIAMPIGLFSVYGIAWLRIHLLELRQKLLNEEMGELNVEIDNLLAELRSEGKTTAESRAKMLKELADLQYVLSGMVVALGLPMQEVFSRVHKSNMSKLVNGKVLKRADGKFLKGPNYQPPYLQDIA